MALYLISYDLMNHATFGQYEKLIAEIKRLGGERVLLSEWAMGRSESAVVLRDHLRQFIHNNDRLLVSEISAANWASWKALWDLNQIQGVRQDV
jgi:hypothetical protein